MGKKQQRKQNRPVPTTDPVAVTASPAPTAMQASAPPPSRFFTPEDWIAAGATFLISGMAFLYYMSPEVTLEDSGELVTGSFNFGVPHPPGYPLWAFLGWVWRHLVPFGNPAWRICLMSVLTGAVLVGVLTLLMTRSIMMLLRSSSWAEDVEEPMKHWIALTVGSCAALLFGFNRGVWLWASVPEMRVLNVFMFILTACTFFAWMMRPQRYALLYATVLIYALGLGVHMTIVVMVLPFLIGAFAVGALASDESSQDLMKRLSAFWEVFVAALLGWSCCAAVNAWLEAPDNGQIFSQKVNFFIIFGPSMPAALMIVGPAVVAIGMLILFNERGWLNWKRALFCTAAFVLGCSMYLYMPIASSTNPPMNWGYAWTKQGFLHAITRGQYERLNIATPLSKDFYIQLYLFMRALLQQFSPRIGFAGDFILGLPIVSFACVTLVALIKDWGRFRSRGRAWLIFVWSAFVWTSVGLIFIINPGLDKQNQEINIKFFGPAHGFFSMLIGYGLALAIAAALARWKTLSRPAVRAGCAALLLLPLIPFQRNWEVCEQRRHDFGYQFGYRMFRPLGDYPDMEKDAVLFGGTDPGRFVPTYMIFCESRVPAKDRYRDSNFDPEGGPNFDRRDVYIITQNALADSTYMSYIRDHYDFSRPDPNNPATLERFLPWQRAMFRWGWHHLHRDSMYPREPIYIPTETDLQRAFQEYVHGVQMRQQAGQPLGPDENVEVDPQGRVSVRGVGGVMAINGILTKWIFERNKDKHGFYVEESYVIPWMYPYLTPYGIIMQINHDPLPSPEENPQLWSLIVSRDKAYWDKLSADFEARPEFRRDNDAAKTFSKQRSAIGGIYSSRHLMEQAEYAYRQALRLCPESPEANFRLAQLYMEQNRIDDALTVLEGLKQLDPLNPKIPSAIQQLQGYRQQRGQLQQLEQAHAAAPRDVRLVIQLAQAYFRTGQADKVPALCDSYLAQPDLSANDMIQIAQVYISLNQIDRTLTTLHFIIERHPQDSQSYYAIALIRSAQGGTNDALDALQKAVQITPQLREQARGDARLNPIHNHPRFQQIVNPPPAPGT